MFNFLRTNTQKSGDHSEHKDSAPSPNSHATTSHNTASSFSFLTTSNNTNDDASYGAMTETSQSSGFSFLHSGGGDNHHETRTTSSDHHHSSEPTSSFSFLNEPTATVTPVKSESSSGFSFLSSEPVKMETPTEGETRPRRDSKDEQVQDLKLSKVAVTKQVKKKKKASRVGLGREEDEDTPNRRFSATELESVSEQNENAEVHETPSSVVNTVPTSVSSYEDPKHEEISTTHVEAEPHVATSLNHVTEEHRVVEREDSNHTEPEKESAVAVENSAFSFLSQSITSNSNHTEPEKESAVAVENSAFSFLSQSITSNPTVQTSSPPQVKAEVAKVHLEKVEPQAETKPNTANKPITSILEQFDKFIPTPSTSTSSKDSKPVKVATPAESTDNAPYFQVPASLSSDLKNIDNKLQSGFNKIRLNYLQSYASQQALLHQIDSLAVQSNQLREKISTLEAKQTALAQVEDFEQADAISIEIESTQRELDYKHNEKFNLLNNLQDLRSNYTQDKQNLIDNIFTNLNQLFLTCTETQSSVEQFNIKLQEYSEEETSRLAVEQQRVEMERSHCQREQQTLNNESQVIEDAIKNQVGDYYLKQEALQSQIATVQDEIKSLEEQLVLKRAFEADLSKSLKQIESKIQEARKKFDRQLLRIQERLETLQKAQRECQQEEDLLAQNRVKIESILERANTVVNEAKILTNQKLYEKNLINLVIDDLRTYSEKHHGQDVISSIGLESSWEAFDILQSNSEAANPKVKAKRDEINNAEAELAKIRGTLMDTRIQYEAKVAKQKSVNEQIEQLELAKKLHAANKRFKEAAATAKELKELVETKEQVEKDIQSNQEIIFEEERQEELRVSRLEQLELELKEEQKLEKQQHISKLSIRIVDVQKLIRKLEKSHQNLAASASPSTSSSTKDTSGILEESIQLYQAELQQLSTMREDLCQKNGFEVPVDIIEEEVEEEEKPIVHEVEDVETVNLEQLTVAENQPEVVADDVTSDEPNAVVAEDNNVNEDPIPEVTENQVTENQDEAEIKVEEEPKPEVDVQAILNEIADLEAEMEVASDGEDFEKAQELLELIEAKRALLPADN